MFPKLSRYVAVRADLEKGSWVVKMTMAKWLFSPGLIIMAKVKGSVGREWIIKFDLV